MANHRLAFTALLALATSSPAVCPPALAQPLLTATASDTVWFWFATCDGPTMRLDLRLDRSLLYTTSVPICRADRAGAYSQGSQGKFSFWFQPRRAIVWSGYSDKEDTSRAPQDVEVHVWQAAADSDFLTLGATLMTSKRILMNTSAYRAPQRCRFHSTGEGLRAYHPPRHDRAEVTPPNMRLKLAGVIVPKESLCVRGPAPTIVQQELRGRAETPAA